ncbi:MAG TPA: OmpA family protein [Thermodesulfovibrionales bacterium]|nr:OmpA family protein [Thermodesulfovibrionales bacterium]
MNKRISSILIALSILALSLLAGCSGYVYELKRGVGFHPVELVNAEKAIAEAQKAGKDKQCPREFAEAKALQDKAWDVYWSCRTKEAIEIAKDAIKKTNALCPPPPKPAPKVIDKMTLLLHFDFDKSVIKDVDKPRLKEAIEFIHKYPKAAVKIEGHTDSIGTEKYNQALSERRAAAVENYIIKEDGISKSKISSAGYGETKPVASNKTKEGRAKNRRVDVLILSD